MAIEGITSYYEQNKTRYYVLTEEQCEAIILTAMTIAEKTGNEVKHPKALALFKEAGCSVEGTRVKIPAEIIKKAIKGAPSKFFLHDRHGNEKLCVGGTNTYYGLGPTNPFYNDFETGQRRDAKKNDVKRTALVADALPNIDFVMSLAGIRDCNANIADVCEMHEMLQNTTKPIVGWGVDVNGCKDIVDMCSAVAGSLEKLQEKPFLAMYVGDPITPLIHPADALDKLFFCVEHKIPAIYASGIQLGTVAPVTIAGGIALGLAENFVGLVLSQLIREGAVFVGSVVTLTVDMLTTHSAYGSPEFCLGHSACTDIYHYLDLPLWSTACATDSKVVDEQAAIESSMSALSVGLSGANLVHDCGFMEGAMSASLEQVVMCDEIIGFARKIVRGFEVNHETLALDIIEQVGPGGQFITHDHTFKHFRKELWVPSLIDRNRYQIWEQNKTTMGQRIREKTERLLKEHKPEPLSPEVIEQIDNILRKAQQR